MRVLDLTALGQSNRDLGLAVPVLTESVFLTQELTIQNGKKSAKRFRSSELFGKKAKRAKHPKRLYHFTCQLWWRFIKEEGICLGEVPLGRGRILNHPNLTVDPVPANQAWARFPGEVLNSEGETLIQGVDKRAVRITVEFPHPDPCLVRWVDLARQSGMDHRTLQSLNISGGGHMDNWWIYAGIIPPGRFAAVEFLDQGRIPLIEYQMIEASRKARTSRDAIRLLGQG